MRNVGYNACQPGKTLTHAAYNSFGGVTGVIGKRAEDVYSEFEKEFEDAKQTLGEVFTELVEVDPERGIPTRKRSSLARFNHSPAARIFIDQFAKARLLVCGDPDKGTDMVEIAHEALLTHWPRLEDWIAERFDDFRLLRQVRQEAAEWKRQDRIESHLWRHERLEPVYAMLKRLQPTLSEVEQDFTRPEAERLAEKLQQPELTHQQRESIGLRLAEIDDPRPGVGLKNGLPDFVWLPVPGGKITLESNAGTFPVAPFYISKYPVTWVQYRSFLKASDGYYNEGWWEGLADREDEPGQQYRQIDNHPAEMVSWYDAVAFCRWLSEYLGYEIRLPTEWEW